MISLGFSRWCKIVKWIRSVPPFRKKRITTRWTNNEMIRGVFLFNKCFQQQKVSVPLHCCVPTNRNTEFIHSASVPLVVNSFNHLHKHSQPSYSSFITAGVCVCVCVREDDECVCVNGRILSEVLLHKSEFCQLDLFTWRNEACAATMAHTHKTHVHAFMMSGFPGEVPRRSSSPPSASWEILWFHCDSGGNSQNYCLISSPERPGNHQLICQTVWDVTPTLCEKRATQTRHSLQWWSS